MSNKNIIAKYRMSENNEAPIEKPHSNDVLLVRKIIARKHRGNQNLTRIAGKKMNQYRGAFYRVEKKMIAQDIVDEIKKLNPPGRFLEAGNNNHSKWNEVDNNRCVEKACQTLRELLKLEKKDVARESSTMHEDKEIAHPPDVSIEKMVEKKDFSYSCTLKQTDKSKSSLSNDCSAVSPVFMSNQDLEKDNSAPKDIFANEGDRKRHCQCHGREASKKPKLTEERSVLPKVILLPVSLIAQSFLSKPKFSVESRHLLKSIAELGDNADGLYHLPNIIASLCSRIEKLEEGA